jgi:hypothetical protein
MRRFIRITAVGLVIAIFLYVLIECSPHQCGLAFDSLMPRDFGR